MFYFVESTFSICKNFPIFSRLKRFGLLSLFSSSGPKPPGLVFLKKNYNASGRGGGLFLGYPGYSKKKRRLHKSHFWRFRSKRKDYYIANQRLPIIFYVYDDLEKINTYNRFLNKVTPELSIEKGNTFFFPAEWCEKVIVILKIKIKLFTRNLCLRTVAKIRSEEIYIYIITVNPKE